MSVQLDHGPARSGQRTYPVFLHRAFRRFLRAAPRVRGAWRLRHHLLNVDRIKFPADKIITRLVYGQRMWVMPNDLIGRHLFYDGLWEGSTTRHFYEGLRPGDTVLDVGANIGQYTVLAGSKVGPAGRVFAVEPGETPGELLRWNMELNGLSNVCILPVAAWDSDTTLHLDMGTPGNCGAAEVSSRDGDGVERVAIPARRLETLLREFGCDRVDVLKIDIEGAELPALRGLEGCFLRRPPRSVYCELLGGHNRFGEPVTGLLDFFQRFGYRAWLFGDGGLEPLNRSEVDEDTRVNLFLEHPGR